MTSPLESPAVDVFQFLKVEVVIGDFDSVAISAHGLLSDPSGIAGFLGQFNPVRFASTHGDPLFYLPSCLGLNPVKVDKPL